MANKSQVMKALACILVYTILNIVLEGQKYRFELRMMRAGMSSPAAVWIANFAFGWIGAFFGLVSTTAGWAAVCWSVTSFTEDEIPGLPGYVCAVRLPFIGIRVPVAYIASTWRWYSIVVWDYVRVMVRAMTYRPAIIVHASEHEENFRHFWRVHYRFRERAAPCHDKEMHGHPRLAAARRGFQMDAVEMLKKGGYVPYDISASRRTVAADMPHYHGWFCARDYAYPRRNDEVDSKTAFTMVDVDYYMDLHLMAPLMRPMCLWTFNPLTDVGHDAESVWQIDRKANVVHFHPTGGKPYVHQLWDYGKGDYVRFTIGCLSYVYALERTRPVSSLTGKPGNHEIIQLQPHAVEPVWSKTAADVHAVTRRMLGNTGVFQDGDVVTIKHRSNTFRLAVTLHETVISKLKMKKSKLTFHEVAMYLREPDNKARIYEGVLCDLVQYYAELAEMAETNGLTYASIVQRSDGTFFPASLARNSHVRVVDAPTNVEARSPTRDSASDAAAVTTRVTSVNNQTVPNPKYDAYRREFVEAVLGGNPGHTTVPLSVEETVQRTERAKTANRIKEAAVDVFGDRLRPMVDVDAFVKAELYTTPGDERNISPSDDAHLMSLARYTYALKDHLKTQSWYCPGSTPLIIARRVTTIAGAEGRKWVTDYSRYDGTLSPWLRQVEVDLYRAAFPDKAGEIGELIQKEISKVRARTRAGAYDPAGSRLSGSSLTTDGNTAINAFVQYCAYREGGKSPEDAYQAIGLCYGDDGVMRGDDCDVRMKKVCDDFGLSIKMEECCCDTRPYIDFVGRIFFNPTTSTSSFQDPVRVWPKIHITRKGNAKDMQENFAAKLACFSITDGKTPVLGDYCRYLLRRIPGGAKYRTDDEREKSLHEAGSWILLESKAKISNSWPQGEDMDQSADLYAYLLKVPVSALVTASERIANGRTVGDVANILTLPEPVPKTRFATGSPFVLGEPLAYRPKPKKQGKTALAQAADRRPDRLRAFNQNGEKVERPQGAKQKVWVRKGPARTAQNDT